MPQLEITSATYLGKDIFIELIYYDSLKLCKNDRLFHDVILISFLYYNHLHLDICCGTCMRFNIFKKLN